MSQPTSDAGISHVAAASSATPPPQHSAPSKDSTLSAGSVEEHLDRLTTAVQEVGHLIHVCTALCEQRCALARVRDEEQAKRTESVQEQLARILMMTQETLSREREVRVTSDSKKYALDLQRAAFGAGSSADSISRSSLMESGAD